MKSSIGLKGATKSDNSTGPKRLGAMVVKDKISSNLLCECYIAEDETTSKRFCIKLLKNEYHSDFSIVKKFLSSPHEVYAPIGNKKYFSEIIKAEKAKDTNGNKTYVYICQELSEGMPLGEWHKQPSIVNNEKKKKEIAKKICEAIRQLHFNKVMHAGLSMESITVTAMEEIKITDYCTTYPHVFGKIIEKRAIEKLRYSAPELFNGIDTSLFSPAPDIFSLALMFQELITGNRVVNGTSFSEIKNVICTGNLPGIDKVLSRAVEVNPALRYSKVEELRNVIDMIGTVSKSSKTEDEEKKDKKNSLANNSSIDNYIKKLLFDYCKTKYVDNHQFDRICLLVNDHFPADNNTDIQWKVHAIIKRLGMFDETLEIKKLKQHIRIFAKSGKISRSKLRRIIKEISNMGMNSTTAEMVAKEVVKKMNVKVTLF